MLGIEAKSVFELNNVISKINNQFGQFILNYDIITNIGAKHFPRNYLINKKHNQKVSFNTGGKEEIINLDKKDFQIIEILIQNPRTNFVDLATKLGLTIDIIRYRYKKLIEKQIIQGFSIVLNHKNFGNLHYRILFKLKNINKEIQKQMFEFANINPNIKIITKCFGTYELTIDIEVEYNEQLREIMSEFRNKFNSQIHHYDVLNIYSIEKFTTLISP